MKLTRLSHVLPVVAVAVTLGSVAQASPEGASHAQIADTTLSLEKAFSDQFVRGNIDRDALKSAIYDVLRAMPETARAGAQEHIDLVLATGQRLATEMTPEQRADAATPPSTEQLGQVKQGQLAGWGWPGAVGFGGLGAFGFPAWGGGWGGIGGWGGGWGTGFSTGTSCINGFCTGW